MGLEVPPVRRGVDSEVLLSAVDSIPLIRSRAVQSLELPLDIHMALCTRPLRDSDSESEPAGLALHAAGSARARAANPDGIITRRKKSSHGISSKVS